MNVRKHSFIFVLYAAVSLIGCNRKQDNTVAEVNGEQVTAAAFAERYAAYLSQGGQRDNIILRQKILNNMVNEQLIYADCSHQGFDADGVYRQRIEQIESQALIDAYAKSITTDTIQVSEPELYREFKAFNTKVKARYLYAETEEGAMKLKEALAQGAKFDSLAKEVFDDPGLANNGGELGYFGWSEMEPAFEDAAFSLPIGEMSAPVRLKIGFGIIQVLDRVANPLASELDYAKAKEKLSRAILQKKTVRLVSEVGHQIANDLRPEFDDLTIALVFKNWHFVQDDVKQIEQLQVFKDTMNNLPIVKFNAQTWTIGEFLKRAAKTTLKQRNRVRNESDVKEFVKGLAVREVLLDRARKAHRKDDKEVKLQIVKMRTTFLLKRWMASVRDTIGQHGWDERLMREQFEKQRKEFAFPPEVNVAEILVRRREEAENILAQLRHGANFAQLAEKFSLRRATAKRGGEIGWGIRGTFGNLGEKFLAARPGELIGPEFVDPYFGVFKILARAEGRPKTFDEAKEQIASMLFSAKALVAVEQAVSALRSKAKISINNEQLANVVIN